MFQFYTKAVFLFTRELFDPVQWPTSLVCINLCLYDDLNVGSLNI